MHHYQDLISLFNRLFQHTEQTVLVKGDNEPLYLPVTQHSEFAQVIFAHGFYQSALHEIAHWCIAGIERRKQIDYGYWYQPDGRSSVQQAVFESVESKPQAIEWLFSLAAGSRFFVSIDNLAGEPTDPGPFKAKVYKQAMYYLNQGLPPRAKLFLTALHQFYRTPDILLGHLKIDEI